MKDNSKTVAIVLVILTIIVLVVSFITGKDKEENKISIVTNYSDFYTVNSCLYRTITHLSSNDIDSLMMLLNDNYKKENKITRENIIEFFPSVTESSTFVSQKMYYESLSKDVRKYYVKGYIDENRIYDGEVLEKNDNDNVYFIVYLDTSNNIFSVELYDGEIFKAGEQNGQ